MHMIYKNHYEALISTKTSTHIILLLNVHINYQCTMKMTTTSQKLSHGMTEYVKTALYSSLASILV